MIHALDNQLHHAVLDTFEATFGKRPSKEQIQIQTTRTEFEGDRTVVVFPLAGMAGAPPQVAADRLGKALVETFDWIVKYGVGKGFLNLTLSDESWSTAIQDALTDSWGFAPKNSKSQVMVEYSSPNTNKPLHLGHLRNNFLGYSVAKILEAAGHEVVKVQIINDRGIHICKSMVAWQKFGQGETPASTGEKATNLLGAITWPLTRHSNQRLRKESHAGSRQKKRKTPVPSCKKLVPCCNVGKTMTLKLWICGRP